MGKIDIYQAVTDRILTLLDQGTVPWRQPFTKQGSAGFPANLVSGKPYRGINVFLLACTAMMEGFTSSSWLTYKQARERGGHVKRGEKAAPIVFWKQYNTQDKETGKDKTVPVLRLYNVFNACQCEGLETPDIKEPEETAEPFEPIEQAAKIIEGYKQSPELVTGGNLACYHPLNDTVRMPEPERFESPESYYLTYFHELTHSTGHSSRLDRGLDTKLAPFGSADYSKEELVAEMGAAFLAASAQISPETIDQSAAYIDGWRRKLKADKKLVVQASGAAQRAADMILGLAGHEQTGPDTALPSRTNSKVPPQAAKSHVPIPSGP